MIGFPKYVEVRASSKDFELWLKQREESFTATDSACLLGIGDDSRATKIKEKAEAATPSPKKLEEMQKLREMAMVVAGNHMEPGIISWFAAESPFEVVSYGSLLRDSRFPWMQATPDAFCIGADIKPIECKNVAFDSGWNWHANSQPKREEYAKLGCGAYPAPDEVNTRVAPIVRKVAKDATGAKRLWREHMVEFYNNILPHMGPLSAPVKYYCQLQWQMSVLGSEAGYIVCVMGGVNRFDFLYRRNDRLIERMQEESRIAWREVEKQRVKLDNLPSLGHTV